MRDTRELYKFPLSHFTLQRLQLPKALSFALEGMFVDSGQHEADGMTRVVSDPEIDLEISATWEEAGGDNCAIYIWPDKLRFRRSRTPSDPDEGASAADYDLAFSDIKDPFGSELVAFVDETDL